MAGLPGTGLGGVFYALLIVWMTLREPWLALRSRSSAVRWLRIARLAATLAAILAALWLEGYILLNLIGPLDAVFAAAGERSRAVALLALAPAVALAPFLILATLIASVHSVRLALRWSLRWHRKEKAVA
jgi:hypothetical protein